MSNLVAELQAKAYQQGYHAGLNGLPWDAADWESEFRPEYRRGRDEGRVMREETSKKGPGNDQE